MASSLFEPQHRLSEPAAPFPEVADRYRALSGTTIAADAGTRPPATRKMPVAASTTAMAVAGSGFFHAAQTDALALAQRVERQADMFADHVALGRHHRAGPE